MMLASIVENHADLPVSQPCETKALSKKTPAQQDQPRAITAEAAAMETASTSIM